MNVNCDPLKIYAQVMKLQLLIKMLVNTKSLESPSFADNVGQQSEDWQTGSCLYV